MQLRKVVIVACAITLIAIPALAQQQRGDIELGLQGFVLTTVGMGVSATVGTVQGKLGFFFTDNFEFGVTPSMTIVTVKGETDVDGGGGAFLTYSVLLKNARAVPYFGAQYYKSSFSTDFDVDPGSVGVNAGVKFFFTRKAAFDVNANYLFSLAKNAEGGMLLFAFGISFLV